MRIRTRRAAIALVLAAAAAIGIAHPAAAATSPSATVHLPKSFSDRFLLSDATIARIAQVHLSSTGASHSPAVHPWFINPSGVAGLTDACASAFRARAFSKNVEYAYRLPHDASGAQFGPEIFRFRTVDERRTAEAAIRAALASCGADSSSAAIGTYISGPGRHRFVLDGFRVSGTGRPNGLAFESVGNVLVMVGSPDIATSRRILVAQIERIRARL